MKLDGTPITILGAGVAGLALARALALRGAAVTVLEQADAIREVGAGLQVSPNGVAVLRGLGLSDGLDLASVRAEAVELRNGESGDPVLRLDLARLAPEQRYAFVHRADLIDLLAKGARAAGAEIRLMQEVREVDLSGPRPRLIMAEGADYAPALLLGADGLHSRLHHALNGKTAPFFTRQVAWRATIPAEPGAPAVAEVHMGVGRHLVSYPMRSGTLRNIVAVEERSRWTDESWSLRDDPIALQLAFEGFNPRVRGWLDTVDQVWLWGLYRHDVARNWHKSLPEGGAAILGDAVHPMLPFLAQGANMALEDAWVLAGCLQSEASPDAAFTAFQTARAPRCSRVVAAAQANARNYHLGGFKRAVAHTALRLGGWLAPNLALRRFDWLYGHDVTRS